MFVGIVVAWVLAVLGGNVFGLAAFANLSEHGKQHTLRIMFWSKLFAGRENFTDKGWQYMQLARLCVLAWPAAIVMIMLTRR